MSLQEKLDTFMADFEAGRLSIKAPDWVRETVHRATRELIASGAVDKVLKAGAKAPRFELNDQDGNPVSSSTLLADGPLVVSFYRGVWCPFCNMDLEAIQAAWPDIEKRGARLVAISPQTESNSRKAQRQHALTLPILSDPHNTVAAQFGLRFTLPDYLQDLYKNTFKTDLEQVNGDNSWTLPMPARFVIDTDGTIVYAEAHADYTRRPEPDALFPAIDKARATA